MLGCIGRFGNSKWDGSPSNQKNPPLIVNSARIFPNCGESLRTQKHKTAKYRVHAPPSIGRSNRLGKNECPPFCQATSGQVETELRQVGCFVFLSRLFFFENYVENFKALGVFTRVYGRDI